MWEQQAVCDNFTSAPLTIRVIKPATVGRYDSISLVHSSNYGNRQHCLSLITTRVIPNGVLHVAHHHPHRWGTRKYYSGGKERSWQNAIRPYHWCLSHNPKSEQHHACGIANVHIGVLMNVSCRMGISGRRSSHNYGALRNGWRRGSTYSLCTYVVISDDGQTYGCRWNAA